LADINALRSPEEMHERLKLSLGKSAQFESVHRRKDGTLINVEISSSWKDIDGQYFLFAASRDITERKRVEEALILNAELLDRTSDSIFLVDLDGNFIYVNETAWKSRGYTQGELMAMNIRELNTPEFNKLMLPRIKELLEKGHGIFEAAHFCKDGSIMPVEVNSCMIESGGRKMMLASTRDITERKKVEAVLKQHKLVLDTSIDGFWMTDMQGYLLEANAAYAKMSGYAVAELAGMHISQLEAIDRPEDVAARAAKIIAQGYDRFETRHRRKNGHQINVEISIIYLAELRQFAVFIHDISERKKAEAALQNSEANLRAMLDNSPYLTWLKDTEGRYITINRVFADYLRLEDIRQAIGKSDLELQPQELAEKYRADDAEVMAARQQKHVEESAFDGKMTHWVETFKTPIIDAHGEVLGTVGFARDITERRRAEEMLRESSANLKAIFESLRSGVAVYRASPDGHDFFINSFNRAAERIENVGREDLIGKNVVDVFPGIIEFGLLDVFRRVWLSGKEEHFPVTFYQDGRVAGWRENHVYKLPNGEVAAIYDDVTKEKQAAEKLLFESESERKRAEELAQQFGYLLQSSFNEIYMFDADSLKFLLTSQGAEKNLGYTEDELHQLTPLDLNPLHTRESFEAQIAPLRSGEQQMLLFETVRRRKDGTTYPAEVRLQLMPGDSPVFLAVVQDITERDRAASQLREFTAHLQTVREEEKASIAREVHDDLGSTLAALKMDAYWLAGKLEAKEMQTLHACAKSMTALLDNAVLATRRIITDLRPTILDEIGLMAALKWQCAEFQKRSGIKCHLSSDENESLEDSLDKLQLINLFRIAQEALTNVARHSGASKVEVDLRQHDKKIALTITDNGRGLPKGHTIAPTSYGMRGMRERVESLQGKIKFDTPPEGGFSVIVKLPLLHGSVKS
jgi:PAS domain S-box-containing protein